MATGQTDEKNLRRAFISYSRTDSNLVLRLAKDLRNAGASIWLDQLDIPVGALWDLEIEKALKNASTMIAVLSVASTSSQNFRNEISYAVAKQKRIIPLLIDNCDTPLNLLRFQRVEYKGDYDQTLAELVRELQTVPGENTPVSPQLPEKRRWTYLKTKRKSVVLGASVVILGLAAWGLSKLFNPNHAASTTNSEETAWAFAQGRDNEAAYNDYMKKFPGGQYIQTAQQKIDSLKLVETQKLQSAKDDQAWSEAKSKNTIAGYLDYLNNFPNGKHGREATAGIALLSSEHPTHDEAKADDQAWQQATQLKTIAGFKNYISTFPNGKHVTEAQKHIKGLEEQQKNDEQNRKDDQAWQAAVRLNTTKAFQDYQATFPKGKYFEAASIKIPKPQAITVSEVLNKITVHVRKDRNDKNSDGQIAYNYYLSGDARYLDVIKEVRYVRNHSTFPEYANHTYHASSDRHSKFNFKGYQWGYVTTIYITVILRDNSASNRTIMDLVYDN